VTIIGDLVFATRGAKYDTRSASLEALYINRTTFNERIWRR